MKETMVPLDQLQSGAAAFAGCALPEACLAGAWLYYGNWDEAHKAAQDLDTVDGSYWHAIIHRREPDEANARYWFRKAEQHPIYMEMKKTAARSGSNYPVPVTPELEKLEWETLFAYCARKS